jgi:Ca2+-binding RTX toxin-like protein
MLMMSYLNNNMESLESRRLMSATLENGTLRIVSGDGADDVTVGLSGSGPRIRVTENGVNSSFAWGDVQRIEVFTGGGNDKFVVSVDTLTVRTLGGLISRTYRLQDLVVHGGDGNDTIQTGRGNDRILGDNQLPRNPPPTNNDGDDVINAGAGNDTIAGGGGSDKLSGGEGNDSIDGDAGEDAIDGGNGNDRMDGGDGGDTIAGGTGPDGNDVISSGGGGLASSDTLDFSKRSTGINLFIDQPGTSGQPGVETDTVRFGFNVIYGTRGNDHFIGTDGDDRFNGMQGNDRSEGRGGDDFLFNFSGNDTILGGDGNDLLDSAEGNALLDGGAGNDNMEAFTGNDTVIGGDGIDRVIYVNRTAPLSIFLDGQAHSGQAGEADLLSTDIERVTGGRGSDLIVGTDADNLLDGERGDDTIRGLGGNDQVLGGDGDDVMEGGDGNDKLDGGKGADSFSGGAGTDTLHYGSRTEDLTIRLDGRPVSGAKDEKDSLTADFEIIRAGSGNDVIFGSNRSEQIFAGAGNDVVRGAGGNDRLDGGDGNDRLIGGDGNDVLIGRAGRDTLYGQNGNDLIYANDGGFDYLFGGVGRDRFRADPNDRLAELEARF